MLFEGALMTAIDVNDLGPILPIGIGVACTLGVIVVGLMMFWKNSLSAKGEDGFRQPQAHKTFVFSKLHDGLIFPGLVLLMIGGGIYLAFAPVFQEFSAAREEFHSNLQSAIQENDIGLRKSSLAELKPIQPLQVQHIDITKFQPHFRPPPPPPRPRVYIDSRGFVHTR
jgi:hypothetical protein